MGELRENQQALRDQLKKLMEELRKKGFGQGHQGQGEMDQLGRAHGRGGRSARRRQRGRRGLKGASMVQTLLPLWRGKAPRQGRRDTTRKG